MLAFSFLMKQRKKFGVVRNKDERRLRALQMIDYKVRFTASNAEIAEEFKVSENTVERELSWARRAQLVAQHEDKILADLMPLARKAIQRALEDSESPIEGAKIALELFKGVLPGFQKRAASGPGGAGDELSRYLDQIRGTLGTGDVEVATTAIEGQIVPALPPAAEEVAPQGDDAPADGDGDGLGILPTESQDLGS